MVAYAMNLLLWDCIRHITLKVTNKKVKYATQKNKWSVCWSFLSTTYLLSLEVDFSNKLSAFLWEQTVRLFLSTFSYFLMDRSSSRHLSKTIGSKKPDHLISLSDILINNPNFSDWVPLIYPPALEIKETTDTASSAPVLDLYLEFDLHSHLRPESMKNDTILILKL